MNAILAPQLEVLNHAISRLELIRAETAGHPENHQRAILAIERAVPFFQTDRSHVRQRIAEVREILASTNPASMAEEKFSELFDDLLGSEALSPAISQLFDTYKSEMAEIVLPAGSALKKADVVAGKISKFLGALEFFAVEAEGPLESKNLNQLKALISIGEANSQLPAVSQALLIYGEMLEAIINTFEQGISPQILKRDIDMLYFGAINEAQKGGDPINWGLSTESIFSKLCLPTESEIEGGGCSSTDRRIGLLRLMGSWETYVRGETGPEEKVILQITSVVGGRVTGKIVRSSDKLEGTVNGVVLSGNRLTGTWSNETGGHGRFLWNFVGDGETFEGGWGRGIEEGPFTWVGNKNSP